LSKILPFVKIVEVGPRDGLQSIKTPVPTSTKIEYINKLTEAHISEIEITGFVHPEWVPQLSDSSEVSDKIIRNEYTTYSALVPNLKGAMKAVDHNLNSISVITTVSESFSQKNTNCSISKGLDRIYEIEKFALENSVKMRVYISTSWDCPFEGTIRPKSVISLLSQLKEYSFINEYVLSDTTGKSNSKQVKTLLDIVISEFGSRDIALHFHDTFGLAEDNVKCGLDNGIVVFDSSTGGIGGCPYAPGASGNISTQTVVDIADKYGFTTGIDKIKLAEAGKFINSELVN